MVEFENTSGALGITCIANHILPLKSKEMREGRLIFHLTWLTGFSRYELSLDIFFALTCECHLQIGVRFIPRPLDGRSTFHDIQPTSIHIGFHLVAVKCHLGCF